MNNKEMYDFIESRLGEPLSNKEKNRLDKLAKQREQEKMYGFMEQHLGEPLTEQDKATLGKWKVKSAKYDMAKASPQSVMKWKPQKSFLWRYGAVAVTSIILCLSISLPITLGNTRTVYVPDYIYVDNTPTPEIPRYTDNIQLNKLMQGDLRAVDGLLLFNDLNDNQYCYDEHGEFVYGITKVESSKEDGRILSYTIDGGWIVVDFQPITTMEVFEVDYRIRTYKYYYFEDYYKDFYATLEKTYNDNKADITDKNELYEFEDIEKVTDPELAETDTEPMEINAFIYNDIVVMFYIKGTTALIYFEYGDNDYFIKATSIDFSIVTGKDFTPDANYIKDEFLIKTLFANLP